MKYTGVWLNRSSGPGDWYGLTGMVTAQLAGAVVVDEDRKSVGRLQTRLKRDRAVETGANITGITDRKNRERGIRWCGCRDTSLKHTKNPESSVTLSEMMVWHDPLEGGLSPGTRDPKHIGESGLDHLVGHEASFFTWKSLKLATSDERRVDVWKRSKMFPGEVAMGGELPLVTGYKHRHKRAHTMIMKLVVNIWNTLRHHPDQGHPGTVYIDLYHDSMSKIQLQVAISQNKRNTPLVLGKDTGTLQIVCSKMEINGAFAYQKAPYLPGSFVTARDLICQRKVTSK